MVAPLCSTVCGAQSAAAIAAAVAEATGCCPTTCATAFTSGDGNVDVPEFAIAVEDGQLVEVTVTGYAVRTDGNVDGIQGGFAYFRGLARRNDASASLPGLAVLQQNTTLQSLSAGLATAFNVDGNTLRFNVDGDTGDYRWDLEMSHCIRDQVVNTVIA